MDTLKYQANGNWLRYPFLLSLLLHVLLLSSMSFVWIKQVPHQKPPGMYVPSYTTYQEPASQPAAYQPPQPQKEKEADKTGLEKDTISTATQVKHASRAASNTSTKVSEAINLVGDKKVVPKPLIILLGKALGAHLVYPKIAMDFRLRGVAFVGFVLHPDGTLTNIQLVQSSRAGVLDDEAIHAVSAMSPVKNVSQYVNKPRPLVVGIIFD